MKFKHSKIKNTAILFEVLTRMVITEAMSGNPKSPTAVRLIKKYFNPNTELHRELTLYRSLLENKDLSGREFDVVNSYLDMVLESRKKLNNDVLRRSKYNLVRDMKETYGETEFISLFNERFTQYKQLASIYKLFEYSPSQNPQETLSCRMTISESLLSEPTEQNNTAWKELPKSVRDLGFKRLIEKFNSKYETFNSRQKNILRTMIYEPVKLDALVREELVFLESAIKGMMNIEDEVVSIKLNELSSLISKARQTHRITNDHVSVALKGHVLISEIRSICG